MDAPSPAGQSLVGAPPLKTPVDLIVLGGGEHAQVVIEAARTRPDLWNVVGFADSRRCAAASRRLEASYLGDDADCTRLTAGHGFVLGIGGRGISPPRERVVARYDEQHARWQTIVHARAWVSPSARLGRGVVVLAGAIVNAGAVIGDHCIVQTGAVVEHHVRLGDFTQVGPGAVLGGGASAGAGSYLGLGCRIRDHVEIGRRVVVGMGAVVVGPVSDEQVVVGVPAKPLPAKPGPLPHLSAVSLQSPPRVPTR